MPEVVGDFHVRSAARIRRGDESFPEAEYESVAHPGVTARLDCRDAHQMLGTDPSARAVSVGKHTGDLYDDMSAPFGSKARAKKLIKYAEDFSELAPLNARDVVAMEALLAGAHFADEEIKTLLAAAADVAVLNDDNPDRAAAFLGRCAIVRAQNGMTSTVLKGFADDGIPAEKILGKLAMDRRESLEDVGAKVRAMRIEPNAEISAVLDVLKDISEGRMLGSLAYAESKRLGPRRSRYDQVALVVWEAPSLRCRLAIDSQTPLPQDDAANLARGIADDAAKWIDQMGSAPSLGNAELSAHVSRLKALHD